MDFLALQGYRARNVGLGLLLRHFLGHTFLKEGGGRKLLLYPRVAFSRPSLPLTPESEFEVSHASRVISPMSYFVKP